MFVGHRIERQVLNVLGGVLTHSTLAAGKAGSDSGAARGSLTYQWPEVSSVCNPRGRRELLHGDSGWTLWWKITSLEAGFLYKCPIFEIEFGKTCRIMEIIKLTSVIFNKYMYKDHNYCAAKTKQRNQPFPSSPISWPYPVVLFPYENLFYINFRDF